MTNIRRIVDSSVFALSDSEQEIYRALDVLTNDRLTCKSCPATEFCENQLTKGCLESLIAWLDSEVNG